MVSPEIMAQLEENEKLFRVFEFMATSKSGRFVPTRTEKSASRIFYKIRDILKLEEEMIE